MKCKVKEAAEKHGMNFRIIDKQHFGISLDETTAREDINEIGIVVAEALGNQHEELVCDPNCQKFSGIPAEMQRTSKFMQAPMFFKYRSETDMMRYMKKLENRDLSLNRCMIPLGSCTMKLNPATSMYALSWPEFGNIHPFVPAPHQRACIGQRRGHPPHPACAFLVGGIHGIHPRRRVP